MAYSAKEWDVVRAFYEAGLSLAEIVARKEVAIKDRSSISKKAKAEGWKKGGENQHLVEKKVQAEQELAGVDSEIQQRPPESQQVINTLASERLKLEKFFRNSNVLLAQTVTAKVQREAATASFQDLNAASSALTRAQENVLGKQPETVINNANTMQTAISIDRSPEKIRAIKEMLNAAIGH